MASDKARLTSLCLDRHIPVIGKEFAELTVLLALREFGLPATDPLFAQLLVFARRSLNEMKEMTGQQGTTRCTVASAFIWHELVYRATQLCGKCNVNEIDRINGRCRRPGSQAFAAGTLSKTAHGSWVLSYRTRGRIIYLLTWSSGSLGWSGLDRDGMEKEGRNTNKLSLAGYRIPWRITKFLFLVFRLLFFCHPSVINGGWPRQQDTYLLATRWAEQ